MDNQNLYLEKSGQTNHQIYPENILQNAQIQNNPQIHHNSQHPNTYQINDAGNILIVVPQNTKIVLIKPQQISQQRQDQWKRQNRIGFCCISMHHQICCCNIFCMQSLCRCIQTSNFLCYCHNADLIHCCSLSLCQVCCENKGMFQCILQCCRHMPICLLFECLKQKGCVQFICNGGCIQCSKDCSNLQCFCENICCICKLLG